MFGIFSPQLAGSSDPVGPTDREGQLYLLTKLFKIFFLISKAGLLWSWVIVEILRKTNYYVKANR
jgi:hypothetical protein